MSYDDVKTYSHEITQLLDALESNFHNCYKVEESGCLPFHNSKKFDIEKESQSRSYSANNGVNNFLLNTEVSSYIRKGENIDEISDLLLLKKHWDQLRVQIKVLFFQLNVASEAISIVKSDNCKSFLERREAKDQSYNYPSFQYLPLVDYFLLSKMESSTSCSDKDASQKSNMESLQNEQDSCTSIKVSNRKYNILSKLQSIKNNALLKVRVKSFRKLFQTIKIIFCLQIFISCKCFMVTWKSTVG